MASLLIPPYLLAVTESVQHRITSGLVDGFTEWWQMPALVGVVAGLVAFAVWMIRRDAAELPPGVAVLLAVLRLGAVAALVAAYLDLERRTEHELVSPSRVAVLIDSSASMTLADEAAEPVAAAAPKCDVDACALAYRSFTSEDCTYQPLDGPRRLCTRGTPPVAAADPAKPAVPPSQDARAQAACNIAACSQAYISFTPADCTYQPLEGPRRLCEK